MIKRIVLMVMVAALMALVMAPVALAIEKRCDDRPCYGTRNADVLRERQGDRVGDTIYAGRGADRINATRYNQDRDVLYGGPGNDRLNAQDGDSLDELYGGPGYDVCYVDDGDLYRGCEEVALIIE